MFKGDSKSCDFYFESFARSNLAVKIVITHPENYCIKPKIQELQPKEMGMFQLFRRNKVRAKRPVDTLLIAWMQKEKWEMCQKYGNDFFNLDYVEGMISLPILLFDQIDRVSSTQEISNSTQRSKDGSKRKKSNRSNKKIKATDDVSVSKHATDVSTKNAPEISTNERKLTNDVSFNEKFIK